MTIHRPFTGCITKNSLPVLTSGTTTRRPSEAVRSLYFARIPNNNKELFAGIFQTFVCREW